MTPRVLERLALLALIILALVPRVRDIGAGFDREFDGYQGAFFAIAAVNYERMGLEAAGGYPVLNVDLPGGSLTNAKAESQHWFVYQNHPPTTALLAWAGLRTLGPDGWEQAWTRGESPASIEAALRFPFLLLHIAGLLALWWLARLAFGSQVALITLALCVYLPVSTMYGMLVNVENPAIPFLLLAVGAYGGFVRGGRQRHLFGMGAAFGAACAVTFAPAFFLPPLVMRSLCKRQWKEGFQVLVVGGLGCLLPILLHGIWSRETMLALGQAPVSMTARAQELCAPWLDGSLPLASWMRLQLAHGVHTLGPVLGVLALIGFGLSLLRAKWNSIDQAVAAREWPRREESDIDLATPMALGALLYLFAFYKHTGEEQWSFWMFAAPAAAMLAARVLHAFSLFLQRLRGGIGPLVILVGSVMLPGLAQFEAWRAQARAAASEDEVSAGQRLPLPQVIGGQLAELLPAGSVGVHPEALGLNLAATWYAWRSLVPMASLDDPVPQLAAERLGLGRAPCFVVLPNTPPASALGSIESLRADLGEATLSTEDWMAWER